MKKILVSLIFLLGTIAYGQSAFAKAEQMYRAKQYEKAKVAFSKLHQQDTKDLDVIERLGDIAGHKQDFEKAMSYYKVLIEAKPNDAHYNFKYGGAMGLYAKNASRFTALRLLDDIKYYLKKAARLDRNHVESRHALSQLYCELPGIVGGSINKSRSYASELLKISPVDGYLAYGFIYEYQEDYDKAIAAYEKAIELGGSIITYRKLAAVYKTKLNDQAKALEVLERAVEELPEVDIKKEITRLDSDMGLVD